MTDEQRTLARTCLTAAEDDTRSFPEILAALAAGGFESYAVDFRAGRASYHLADGDTLDLPIHADPTPIAAGFDVGAVRAAIAQAQALAPGYTYRGFCTAVRRAGCAGYAVSLPGRRALYFGRTAETWTEHFPQ